MARDGNGVYSNPHPTFVTETAINPDEVNANNAAIATALTGSVASDGQTTITADLPMSGFRHTGVGNASARNSYAAAGQVQDGSFTWCGVATGTNNALALSPSPAITAYATGQRFRFKAGASASDNAVTIAVSGLAAKAGQINDAALSASVVIEANKYYEAFYDGTAFQITQISPAAATLGTAAALDTGTASGELPTNAEIEAAFVAQGLHTIWLPAGAWKPTTTSGAESALVETTAGRPDLNVLDFDASADEFAQCSIAMPKSWNNGVVKFQAIWTSETTDADGVTWALQGVSCADGDTADIAFGTAVTVDDLNQSTAEDIYITDISGDVTLAGTPGDNELTFLQIYRDVSDANDTAAEDARLIGVRVLYTIDAKDDS